MTPHLHTRPATLPQLLELARVTSIRHHSDLVLCLNALPWMDMALSADLEGGGGDDDDGDLTDWRPDPLAGFEPAEAALQRRWAEVAAILHHVNEPPHTPGVWHRAMLSFGLLRCWPTPWRDVALRSHAPFCSVIDCRASWQRCLAA